MHAGYKRMTEANLRQARQELEHQKKLLETGLLAQEKERTRIAADLHDGLIGKLSVIRMKSQIGQGAVEIEELLGDSIAEARRISHDLMPPMLEFSTVEELIARLIEPWEDKLKIYLYADVRTTVDVSPEFKIQLLRIVQELITNIVKHAQATNVKVHLRHTNTCLSLSIADNGRGFDTALHKAGLGLGSLEMRAQYLNGQYRIKSAPGKGARALISMSLQSQFTITGS